MNGSTENDQKRREECNVRKEGKKEDRKTRRQNLSRVESFLHSKIQISSFPFALVIANLFAEKSRLCSSCNCLLNDIRSFYSLCVSQSRSSFHLFSAFSPGLSLDLSLLHSFYLTKTRVGKVVAPSPRSL